MHPPTFIAPVAALFVPANRPDRFDKARTSGADGVILDLEDAVAHTAKAQARAQVEAYLAAGPAAVQRRPRLGVRVNAVQTDEFAADMALLARVSAGLDFLLLPMVDSVADIQRFGALARAQGIAPLALIAQIETAQGLLDAPAIARSDRVATLAFGAADFCRQLGIGISEAETELLLARQHLAVACAAAGRPAPLDTPYMNITDLNGCRRSARHARGVGMGGKLCIHPAQVAIVQEVFTPDAEELAQARRVLDAFEAAQARGCASLRLADGTFIDYPIAARARELLARHT